MAQRKGLVLITGINGYIAQVTAKAFLDAGYNVRGTARSKDSSLQLLGEPFKRYFDSGHFEVVEVKDITVRGAFAEAVKGVNAICHLAAPISLSFTDPEPVMKGARLGTAVLLDSAYEHAGPQLRTVAHMSSIAAIWGDQSGPYTFTEADWNDVSEAAVERLGGAAGPGNIYKASKTASEKVFWAFRDDKKPAWTMTAINPSFVVGPPVAFPPTADGLPGTTMNVWRGLSGQTIPASGAGVGEVVDVRDVARIFVFTIDNPDKTNGERFLASGAFVTPQVYYDILNQHYPARRGIIQLGEPGQGYKPDYSAPKDGWQTNNSKVPQFTGQGWIPFEKTVLDAAKAFERYL